jgi:hypothetical protein
MRHEEREREREREREKEPIDRGRSPVDLCRKSTEIGRGKGQGRDFL